MIEVGEYVRIKNGDIGKVFKIEGAGQGTRYLGKKLEKTIYCIENNDNTENYRYKQTAIVRHSKNIIDLIEEGDYVNGERVFATENRINDNGEKVILTENYDEWTDNGVTSNKDIKTILTKELFEANCYKVKEEIC